MSDKQRKRVGVLGCLSVMLGALIAVAFPRHPLLPGFVGLAFICVPGLLWAMGGSDDG